MLSPSNSVKEQEIEISSDSADIDSVEVRNLSIPEKTQLLRKIELLNQDKLSIKKRALRVELALSEFGDELCKNVFVFLRKLNELKMAGKEISVKWYYPSDNLELKAAGEDFREIFNLNIDLLEREN